MSATIFGLSYEAAAAIVAAFAAVAALWVGAIANKQSARAQSMESVFSFLDRSDEHTRALRAADGADEFKRELRRTFNFFEAVCLGVTKGLYPAPAQEFIRSSLVNFMAAIELSEAVQGVGIPTNDTYEAVAAFLKKNRRAINNAKAEIAAANPRP